MRYKVIIAPSALEMLKRIEDRRIRGILIRIIDELAIEPGKKGKPLMGSLEGLRSIRAVGQRYRIIYKVKNDTVEVFIIAVGLRKEGDSKDIYSLLKKMVKHNLLG